MQPLTLREIKLFLENFGSMFFVSHRRLVARCLKHPCLVQWYIRVGTMQVRPCWYNVSTSMLVQCKYVHVGTMQVRPCWYMSEWGIVLWTNMAAMKTSTHGVHRCFCFSKRCETHWEFNIYKFFSGWPNYCNDLELTLPPTTNPCFIF